MQASTPVEPEGHLVIRTLAMPKDTNANGDIFGGWLVSQMDLGGALMAKQIAKQRIVTVSIDQMSFIRPVSVGDTICCYAECLKIGRTSIRIQIQVWAVPYDSDQREIVTQGIFTFVAIDADGQPVPVQAN